MSTLPPADADYQRALAAAHKFNLEDITTNRAGQMTDVQRSRLRFRPVIGCFGLLILFGGFLLLAALASLAAGPDGGTLFALILGLLFAGGGVWIAWRWHKEISENRVERCEGVITKVEENKRIHTGPGLIPALTGALISAILSGAGVKNYFYQLDNGVKIKVSKAAYQALNDRRPHCVYYSPYSRRILAVEALPDTGTSKGVPTFAQFS